MTSPAIITIAIFVAFSQNSAYQIVQNAETQKIAKRVLTASASYAILRTATARHATTTPGGTDMNAITQMFVNAIGGTTGKTATVYKDGEVFATYSIAIAIECANEIGGDAVDDETGEILN